MKKRIGAQSARQPIHSGCSGLEDTKLATHQSRSTQMLPSLSSKDYQELLMTFATPPGKSVKIL